MTKLNSVNEPTSLNINLKLQLFEPISLADTSKVEFMDRVDYKYIFPIDLLPKLLKTVADRYCVTEINGQRAMDYTTTYYDTNEKLMYYQHLHGKLNRFKIRHRRYEVTGDCFMEIKKKTNKGRTVKHRVKCGSPEKVCNKDTAFIEKFCPFTFADLTPTLTNSFTRITLVGRYTQERITLDFGIRFTKDETNQVALPFLGIAEIKCNKSSVNQGFAKYLREMGIRPQGFSKYCTGVALTSNVSINALKMKLSKLNTIEDEYYSRIIAG
jgi:hypothetical protein